ncbi:pantothenate kinase, type III [Belliella baltica DSM 15883]|uniref:Type III pantothenate kinase n=1 Tax=Belliella baltica (strain DSM 15883 / CIP 108006 / LMG 21964 / BA134) TaxID=866536 RepID=I3Z1Z5_BELBD|nr:type III pantothenate kinase [Belliella baltica]AFL83263.1 pantothenate kinase, type III [Belliella baltica DSM 15883]
MFLSIDAGNSNIVFGFYDDETKTWKYECRVNTSTELSLIQIEKELHLFFLENDIKIEQIDQIGFSSVVPEINRMIAQFCSEFLGKSCYLISGKSYQKLKVSTKRPNEIGTDLMCNVVAAYEVFMDACVIVDFGTALTFTVVDYKGAVQGVNIVPGLKTAMRALVQNTSKLPEVKLTQPNSAIGKNTIESIQSGLYFGYSGLVRGMLFEIEKELGHASKIIATGGLSSIITNLKSTFDIVDRNLTLEGIRLITLSNLHP